MEYQEHYDNWQERNTFVDTAQGNGYRMLHDDYDEDWVEGDEPHGTLTFTDEPPAQAPIPEPLVFIPLQGGTPPKDRLDVIEEFLGRAYPGGDG